MCGLPSAGTVVGAERRSLSPREPHACDGATKRSPLPPHRAHKRLCYLNLPADSILKFQINVFVYFLNQAKLESRKFGTMLTRRLATVGRSAATRVSTRLAATQRRSFAG